MIKTSTLGVSLSLLLVVLVLGSGCVQKVLNATGISSMGECGKLENKLKDKGLDCRCYPTDMVPQEVKNVSDLEGKCYCTCKAGGKQYNISVVSAPTQGTKVVNTTP